MASSFGLNGPRGLHGRDLDANLGSMRDDVTLRSTVRTKGTGGFASNVPTTIVTVKAEVALSQPVGDFKASDTRGQVAIEVRIRYRSDVKAFWELTWKGDTFQILEPPVNYDGRRRFLWLRCGRTESAQSVA